MEIYRKPTLIQLFFAAPNYFFLLFPYPAETIHPEIHTAFLFFAKPSEIIKNSILSLCGSMTRCLSSIFTHFSGSFQYSFSPYSAFNKPFFSSDNILDFFTIHSQNSRISRRIPVCFEESKTTKYLLFLFFIFIIPI